MFSEDYKVGSSLTSNVPKLETDNSVVVPVEDLEGKVHPNGGTVMLTEELVNITLDDGGLPSTKFSNHQYLVKMLPFIYAGVCLLMINIINYSESKFLMVLSCKLLCNFN